MKLSEIKINPKNPRIIKDDRFKKLVKSVEEFPKMMKLRPIVIDEQGMVLGGNMRLKVLQHLKFKEIPDEWVKRADELTEEEKQRFIVADNVDFGLFDWETLQMDWDMDTLKDWGLELPGFDVSPDQFGEGFSLPDGDKAPFQQMTFTLADEQAILIQNCIGDVKKTDEYKYMETAGNENSNGNALYLIVSQWDAQRK